jgi:hypothetical protein
MSHTGIHKSDIENWIMNGDCLNLIGDLTSRDLSEISKLDKIRVIQPWKFMPSEETWMEINEKIFTKHPDTKLHIWADTIKSDFIFLGKMSNVKILDLNQVKFKELETFEKLTQLRSLALINGNVNKLNFLANLKQLEHLEIGRIRGLSDISFISQLINLESLDINNQAQIIGLPDLKRLSKLKIITLSTLKNLKDISTLSNLLNLEELSFHGLNKEINPVQFDFLKDMRELRKVNSYFNTEEKRNEFENIKNELLKNMPNTV